MIAWQRWQWFKSWSALQLMAFVVIHMSTWPLTQFGSVRVCAWACVCGAMKYGVPPALLSIVRPFHNGTLYESFCSSEVYVSSNLCGGKTWWRSFSIWTASLVALYDELSGRLANQLKCFGNLSVHLCQLSPCQLKLVDVFTFLLLWQPCCIVVKLEPWRLIR